MQFPVKQANSSVNEDSCLLQYDAMLTGKQLLMFCRSSESLWTA
jgi:hypothetical protein